MIKSYKNKANLGLAAGITISLISRIVLASGAQSQTAAPGLVQAMVIASFVGTALFVFGCVMYALAKGRSGWWGAFGLLSLIGLIVLVCLKDHARDGYVAEQRGFAPIMPGERPPTLPPRG